MRTDRNHISFVIRHCRQVPLSVWWRLLWVVILALHVPATARCIAGVCRGETSSPTWSTLILLLASNLFFLIELWAAPSLRLLTNRRAALAFVLVIVILHAGAFERAFPTVASCGEVHSWFAAAAVLTGLDEVRRRLRHAPSPARRTSLANREHRIPFCFDTVLQRVFLPCGILYFFRSPVPRAPPVGWLFSKHTP
jgi:hypothetical protein